MDTYLDHIRIHLTPYEKYCMSREYAADATWHLGSKEENVKFALKKKQKMI